MTKKRSYYTNELIGEKYENPELSEKGETRIVNDDLIFYKTKSHPLYKLFSKKENTWIKWDGKDLLATTFFKNKINDSISIRIRTGDGKLKYALLNKNGNFFQYKGQSCFRLVSEPDKIGGLKIYLRSDEKIYLQSDWNVYENKEFRDVYYDDKTKQMIFFEI